jgi:hypothetical protein
MTQIIINEINRVPEFAVHDDYIEDGNRELLVYKMSGSSMSERDLDELYEIAHMFAEVLYVQRDPRDAHYALIGIGAY